MMNWYVLKTQYNFLGTKSAFANLQSSLKNLEAKTFSKKGDN
jgi:hypothetical protein